MSDTPAAPGPNLGAETAKIAEAGIAFAIAIGILVAIGDTPLYPIAFGMAALALLYVLLEHSDVLTTPIGFVQKALKG